MEKRFFLALVLTGAVMVLTPVLFPRAGRPIAGDATGSGASSGVPGAESPAARVTATPPEQRPQETRLRPEPVPGAEETVTIRNGLGAFTFSTVGATPVSVTADSYPALGGRGGRVTLRDGGEPLLRFRVLARGDTLRIDKTAFIAVPAVTSDRSSSLTFTGTAGSSLTRIRYDLARDNYVASATVEVGDVGAPAFLLVDLPSGFDTQEADSLGDRRSLAYAVKPVTQGARGTAFSKLDERGPARSLRHRFDSLGDRRSLAY